MVAHQRGYGAGHRLDRRAKPPGQGAAAARAGGAGDRQRETLGPRRHVSDGPGSRIVVIGLGLVGQMTLQLLRAYGYDGLGIDPDPAMVALAESAGLAALPREAGNSSGAVSRRWAGAGADAVLITAATSSSDP